MVDCIALAACFQGSGVASAIAELTGKAGPSPYRHSRVTIRLVRATGSIASKSLPW